MTKPQLIAVLTENGITATNAMTLPQLRELHEQNLGPIGGGSAVATKEQFMPTIPEVMEFKGSVGGLVPFQKPFSGAVEVTDIVESSKKKNIIVVLSHEGETQKITLADLAAASDKNPNAGVVTNLSNPGKPLKVGDKYCVVKNFKMSRTTTGEGSDMVVTNTVSAAE